MKELIDKAEVVVKIKKLRQKAMKLYGFSQFNTAYNNVLESIDTLEVKDVVAEQEGICNGILNTIIGDTWHIIIPLNKAELKHGDKVKIFITKEK